MLYSEIDQQKIKTKLRKQLILNIAFFVIALGVIIPTCFFINDKTLIFIAIIDSFVLSVFFCVLIYSLINIVTPLFRFNKTILSVLASNESEITYDSAVKGKIKTINHTEKVYIVDLIKNKEHYYVYLDSRFENLFQIVESSHKVKIRNNYIVEIL